jgi:hypothetical protein
MRRSTAGLVLLVLLSSVLHWLVIHGIEGPWIVPDELIYADRGYTLWHHGPWSLLHGSGAGYSLLYPLVAGVPLSIGRATTGYALLHVVQPVVASLAVVPVFFACRRLMDARWALVAAALTAASPLVLYSGFVMTEVLFYPLAALTLLLIARAVETATVRDQAIALVFVVLAALTRSQAVSFAFVLPVAALLEGTMARDFNRLRRFAPSFALLALGIVVVAVVPGLVGAYSGTLRGSYPLGSALHLVVEHLALAALIVAILPFAALIILSVDAFRGAEADRRARALLAVTVAATAILVVQVGFFAARYAPHLLGRDLTPLPPLLFSVFALWLARGAPRRFVRTSLCVYALVALLLLMPWDRLVNPVAFADTFDLILISKLPWSPVTTLIVFSVAVLLALLALPRRLVLLVLPAVTFAVLVASSAIAARDLRGAAATRRADLVGPTPDWVDRAADGPVALVYGGEQLSSPVWLERFWNHRIRQVISVGGLPVPGPIAQTRQKLGRDGLLQTAKRYVVAPDRFQLIGSPVAHLAQAGLDISGLTLWRVTGPARVSTITNAIQPNGDMTHPATVSVYDCTHGSLELTLIPKATTRLAIRLNGRLVVNHPISGDSWNQTVPVPASSRPRVCTFTIFPQPLLGSTRIVFNR